MIHFISDKIRKDAKQKALQNISGEGIISADGRLAFAIDTARQKLIVVNENNNIREFGKKDILEVNMEEENEKGYKRSLFSTLLWYEIGKLIDSKGGLQKVLSGWVTEKEILTVKKIYLRLSVKDYQKPYYDFIIYEKGFMANKRECYELGLRWYSLINVLKHQ